MTTDKARAEAVAREICAAGDMDVDSWQKFAAERIADAIATRDSEAEVTAKAMISIADDLAEMQHGRNCGAWLAGGHPDNTTECTCGLVWRRFLKTEQAMHAAWRKRAEESERETKGLREAVLTLATEIRLRIIERESIALGEPDAWIKRSAVLKFVIEERLAHPIAKAAVERAGGDR